ncbi:hypothetical protein [Arthrobacter sp. FW306-04-A]|uniref:hypothetical protein n=1 Tax=Arthrobacter sp. FW306-04-A TaxID=2879619 RepID=UPI0037BFAA51|nr:hypothetical protein LFT43_14745 [Arthrobacter sp. FW306-04-A]
MAGLAAAALAVLLMAGCAGGPEAGATAGPRNLPSTTGVSKAVAEGAPSASAKMVCAEETQTNIVKILSLSGPPRTTDSWADKIYTCTYALPAGPLVLSVKEAADPASAHAYFDGLSGTTASARPIEGMANLGFPAFEGPEGSVVFVKDNFILKVDAEALPATLGPHGVSRGAFAYEVATAVLACWSE